jgi:nucleoside-diphosphate-sugar epimerase
MKILLTGSNGFIGSTIKDYLCTSHILKTLGRNYKCDYKFNLLNHIPPFVEKFDVVIHGAGKAHSTRQSLSEIDSFYKVNYYGTVNLLKALENSPPLSFIFISTVAVYGLPQGVNISEGAPLLATDPYGKSKILAENAILKWCGKNDVKCTILRLPLVVGKDAPGNLRAMINGIKAGYYFTINRGNARKSMVLVDDVAKILLKVSSVGGIYNLTDGYHPSFYELGNLIARQSGKSKVLNMPLVFANIAAKMGDFAFSFTPLNTEKLIKITSTLTFDDSKARVALGWNPTPVLEGFKI